MRRLDLSGRRDDASLGSELNCLDISSLSSSRSLQAYTFKNQHIYNSNEMLHATFEKKFEKNECYLHKDGAVHNHSIIQSF